MKPWAYYNEVEPAAAHVMRALIAANVIAPGEVDERSIVDVRPDDLRGFRQCHFFAGGGLWSVAARLAGWPDDRPLWTGSCPCQPFSVAGKGRGAGTDDPRHLWPDFFRLIRACRPPVVVGEQVAGAAGYGWFDGVSADLEGEGYASRAVDIPACAVDAPHIRQRLYWVAHSERGESLERRDVAMLGRWAHDAEQTWLGSGDHMGHAEGLGRRGRQDDEDGRRRGCAPADTGAGGVALGHADGERSAPRLPASARGREGDAEIVDDAGRRGDGPVGDATRDGRREGRPEHGVWGGRSAIAGAGGGCGMADASSGHASAERQQRSGQHGLFAESRCDRGPAGFGERRSFWHDAELRLGADGKARRVKPGVRLLVDGLPGRVGLLRIGGNAIVPQVGAQVLAALMDVS